MECGKESASSWTVSRASSPDQKSQSREWPDDGVIHPPASHDRIGHDRDPILRHLVVQAPARERSAVGGFSADLRKCQLAGREPGNDGCRGRDTARKTILDYRRNRQHDLVEPARL